MEKAKAEGTAKYVVEDLASGAVFATRNKEDADALANIIGSKSLAFSSIRIPGDDDYDKERQEVPPGLGTALETDLALATPKKSSPDTTSSDAPLAAIAAQDRRAKFKSAMLKSISGEIAAERKAEWEEVRGELNDAITQDGQWDNTRRFVSLETTDGNSIVLSKAEADLYAGKGSPAALQQSASDYYDGKVINRDNPAFATITGDEWSAQFKPERDPDSNTFRLRSRQAYRLYDTLGEVGDEIPSERIWTLREEDGRAYMSPGIHAVNRLGYYVTENEWHTPNWQAEIEEA